MPCIRTVPRLTTQPWAGSLLASEFGKGADPAARIGESWEVWPENPVVGRTGVTQGELVDLPILVKLLNTRGVLSVQVHPDDADAARLCALPRGKAEGWVVLRAEPGAQIAYGLNRTLSADELRARAQSGRIEEDLAWLEVRPGDVIDVPPGTIHAIGAGLLLYEVQQPTDLTFRLYDWGRGRALHLDEAVAVSIREPIRPTAVPVELGEGRLQLLSGPSFHLERLDAHRVRRVDGVWGLTAVEGQVRVDGEPLRVGETVLVDGAEIGGVGLLLAARA